MWTKAAWDPSAPADGPEPGTNISSLILRPLPSATESANELDPYGEAVDTAGIIEVPSVIPEIGLLGHILEVHRTPQPWNLGVAILVGMAILGAIAAAYSYGLVKGIAEPRAICITGVFAITAFAMVYLFFRDLFLPLIVLVFQGGLAKIRGRRIEEFAWVNVAAYFEGYVEDNGIVVPGRIKRQDGRVLAFKDLEPGSQRKLDQLARREVWKTLYPVANKEYEAGGTVDYGPLGVCKTGLVRMSKTLAWEQIARIRVELPDLMIVRRRGSLFLWFTKRIRTIPNFFILKHFIELHVTIELQKGIRPNPP